MRLAALLLLLLCQAAPASDAPGRPEYLRYRRDITLAPGNGQACAALDAEVFAHAAPALSDLRLFAGEPSGSPRELPYVLTISQSATSEDQPARIVNLVRGIADRIEFDVAMPPRPYSEVILGLAARDFVATASVWGEPAAGAPAVRRTALGSFTLFDLSSQRLSRDTTLPLVESTFPFLHVQLTIAAAPESRPPTGGFTPSIVTGAVTPPSRMAQTVHTTVASTASFSTSASETRASLVIPARVPVEHVSFMLAPGYKGNFSRNVRIRAVREDAGPTATAGRMPDAQSAAESHQAPHTDPTSVETLSGTIFRVDESAAGHQIHDQQLGFQAILGANLQSPARVEIAIENGNDRPLPITGVRLEMRQRRLCFDADNTAAGLALFYGDSALHAPAYEYQQLFRPALRPIHATLGPERLNPDFHTRPAAHPTFTEQSPYASWLAAIAILCIAGTLALRAARSRAR